MTSSRAVAAASSRLSILAVVSSTTRRVAVYPFGRAVRERPSTGDLAERTASPRAEEDRPELGFADERALEERDDPDLDDPEADFEERDDPEPDFEERDDPERDDPEPDFEERDDPERDDPERVPVDLPLDGLVTGDIFRYPLPIALPRTA